MILTFLWSSKLSIILFIIIFNFSSKTKCNKCNYDLTDWLILSIDILLVGEFLFGNWMNTNTTITINNNMVWFQSYKCTRGRHSRILEILGSIKYLTFTRQILPRLSLAPLYRLGPCCFERGIHETPPVELDKKILESKKTLNWWRRFWIVQTLWRLILTYFDTRMTYIWMFLKNIFLLSV